MAVPEIRRNLYVSLVVLALMIGFLIWAFQFDPRGRLMPVLVAWAAIALCILDVIAHTDTRIGRRIAIVLSGTFDQMQGADGRKRVFVREVVACIWLCAATAAVMLVGFLPAIPVYVFAYMVLHGGRSVRQSGITAIATVLFVWVVFEIFLQYEIYRGALFSSL